MPPRSRTKKRATSATKLAIKDAAKDAAGEVHCSGGVCDPRRTQGLKAPAPKGKYTLVALEGPGTFLSAMVTKQGGATGITFVELDIDGRNVVAMSFAGARNFGLVQDNPFGIELRGTGGPVEAFTIGWPTPLVFKERLTLRVIVDETGVVQIIGLVVSGSAG